MCVKSSNLKNDMLMFSCGNEDDAQVKIWNLKDQSTVAKYSNNNSLNNLGQPIKKPYYYLNVVYLKDPEENDQQLDNINEERDEDKVRKGFIIVAVSIKSIDVFFKNPLSSEVFIETEFTQDDVGSYLSSMTIIKHNESNMSLLVGNVNGIIEVFNIKYEIPEFKQNGDESMASSLNSKEDQKSSKSNENGIKIDSEVDVLSLIAKRRKNSKFSELEDDLAEKERLLQIEKEKVKELQKEDQNEEGPESIEDSLRQSNSEIEIQGSSQIKGNQNTKNKEVGNLIVDTPAFNLDRKDRPQKLYFD